MGRVSVANDAFPLDSMPLHRCSGLERTFPTGPVGERALVSLCRSSELSAT